ncbi:MAG: hypothetical protein FJ000_01520, partial [Actinobacteria bacterium]|nr:hypothetical protein [Actinomycetota bacterium]
MRRPLPYPLGDPQLMPRSLEALIVYEGLPVADGGAHELGRRDPVSVWRRLDTFLRDCAAVDEHSATVSLQESVTWLSSRESRAVRRELSARFGRPHRAGAGWGAGHVRDHFWGADPDDVEATLLWLSGLPRLPDVCGSPAVFLGYEARFRLVDLESGRPLPHQGGRFYGEQDLDGLGLLALGESRLFARLSERPSCNLVLSLPFPGADDEARGYVAELQRRLPFALSVDDFTQWRRNDARTGYTATPVQVLGSSPEKRQPARRAPGDRTARRVSRGRSPAEPPAGERHQKEPPAV